VRRGDVIEYEGIVVEANDDGTLDLLIAEYTGDEATVVEGIRGVFPAGGPYSLPVPGQVVVVERRFPSRDPRIALRWTGHELELPDWLDVDRTGIRSRSGRMAIIFDEDLAGDDTGEPALLLGGLKADQQAVLGNVLVTRLEALIDQLVTAIETIAGAQYGAQPGPMATPDVQLLTGPGGVKEALVGADGEGGLKAQLAGVLSDFIRVAKTAPEAEEAPERTAETIDEEGA
jgi:hypothetical protein